MQSSFSGALVIVLLLATIVGIVISLYFAKQEKRVANFRTLALLNYVVVVTVSGIVHLQSRENSLGGYVSIRNSSELATTATVGSIVGLASLTLGLMRSRNWSLASGVGSVKFPLLRVGELRLIRPVALLVLLVSLYALTVVRQYSAQLENERIIELSGGLARFSYVSHWFIWAVAAFAVLFIYSERRRSVITNSLVTLVAVSLIAGSLMWTGGRSIVLVMALPLLFTVAPKLKSMRWLVLLLCTVAGILYVLEVTSRRIGNSSSAGILGWLDWQWGRFSMLGWASGEVEQGGLLLGETIAFNYVNTAFGVLRLLGINIPNPEWQTILNTSGESILRNSEAIYIVPGLVAELYLNFGYIGIAVGMYLVGRIVNWVNWRFINAGSAITALLFAYIGTLLIFRTVSADSGALISYLLYSGFPLLVFGILSKVGAGVKTNSPHTGTVQVHDFKKTTM